MRRRLVNRRRPAFPKTRIDVSPQRRKLALLRWHHTLPVAAAPPLARAAGPPRERLATVAPPPPPSGADSTLSGSAQDVAGQRTVDRSYGGTTRVDPSSVQGRHRGSTRVFPPSQAAVS